MNNICTDTKGPFTFYLHHEPNNSVYIIFLSCFQLLSDNIFLRGEYLSNSPNTCDQSYTIPQRYIWVIVASPGVAPILVYSRVHVWVPYVPYAVIY